VSDHARMYTSISIYVFPTSISQSISLYLSLFTHFHDNLHGGKIL